MEQVITTAVEGQGERLSLRRLWVGLLLLLGSVLAGMAFALLSAQISPWWGAALLPAAAIGIYIMHNPSFGFLCACAVIPLERLGRFTADSSMYTFSLMRIIGVLALGSILLYYLSRGRKLRVAAPVYLYTIYWLLGLLTLTHTCDFLGNVRASGAILGNLLFFFLVINAARSWRIMKMAVAAWLLISVLIGLYTVYDWHFGHSFSEAEIGVAESRFSTVLADTSEYESLDTVRRATGPTSHSAVYGINLIMALPFLAFYWCRFSSVRYRAVIFLATLVILYNIFLTNTRAVLLLTVLVFLMMLWRRLLRITPGVFIAAMLVGVSMLPLVPDAIYERVLNPANYTVQQSGTLRARLHYWRAGLIVIEENWMFGIGPGNQQEIPRYLTGDAPSETTVHNEYLQTMMELGVVGWLVFFSFVFLILRYSFQAAEYYRCQEGGAERYLFLKAAQVSMISVLIYGLQVDVFHFPLKGWWLIAGLVTALHLAACRMNAQTKIQQKG